MDVSKLKLELYDFLAVVIPGLLLICDLWIAIRGWSRFAQTAVSLNPTGLALLVLLSFALGPILQEAADVGIKFVKGRRFLKLGRDKLWQTEIGLAVRGQIKEELGYEIASADAAFDYCLTRVQPQFTKRDLFVANADFARSLLFISAVTVAPVLRLAASMDGSIWMRLIVAGGLTVLLVIVGALCWRRMVRFRLLSEEPVFHAFLACGPARPVTSRA